MPMICAGNKKFSMIKDATIRSCTRLQKLDKKKKILIKVVRTLDGYLVHKDRKKNDKLHSKTESK